MTWRAALLALGILAACDTAEDPAEAEDPSSTEGCTGAKCDSVGVPGEETFEFIVVGSGAGGGPLAANLARNGHQVLLLEAGEDFGHKQLYQVPSFHALSTEEPGMAWHYYVDHYTNPTRAERDTKLADVPRIGADADGRRGVLYPRGGTVGGSTAVNAMITVYPHASDWNRMAAQVGDSSWKADNMRQYFQHVERNGYIDQGSDAAVGHGFDGWLGVERFPLTRAITDTRLLKVAGGAALGFVDSESDSWFDIIDDTREVIGLMKRDINAYTDGRDDKEGVFAIPTATSGGARNGTRDYIIDTIAEGYPLTLRTRSLVTKVILENQVPLIEPKAVGVEYLAGARLYRAEMQPNEAATGTQRQVFASGEVILSAGAFNTPQLLKLSGIGPREELDALGIPVQVDLPGVGENLQDRYEVGIVFETDGDFKLIEDCTFAQTSDDPCLIEWQEGKGPYSSNGAAFSVIKRSTPAEAAGGDPDLFIFGAPGVFKGYYPGYSKDAIADKHHFTWVILKAHTGNRAGTVKLRSTNPRDYPAINFKYFDDGTIEQGQDVDDVTAVVDAIEFVREVGKQTDRLMLFGDFDEVWPGPDAADDRQKLEDFVRDESWGHHASCSAKMGTDDDPMAVLDSRFNVRGVSQLRVVDASVFPEIPGFFIVTSVYMASEKATDTILEDWGETRAF